MNRISFILLVILPVMFGNIALGQKYKDVFPMIANASDENAVPILKEYLKVEPEHPNSNLLLAMIYDRRYREADVLTEYEKAIANAERAKLRLIKAQLLVDDKEVRKNMEYYQSFSTGIDSKGRPITSFEVIASTMSQKLDSVNQFLEKVPTIYSSFVKAVEAYDRAIKIFYDINSSYNSLDDLYLLYNDELRRDLELLKSSYDSTVFHLDRYKTKIADFPIKGYEQNYIVRDIETYRLSGLITQSDFLNNVIVLWNYGKWADDVNLFVANNVASLRSQIKKYDDQLQEGVKKAQDLKFANTYEPVPRNKELVFKLKKYDNNSVLTGLLEYKQSLQSTANRAITSITIDTATNIDLNARLAFYGEMVNSYYLLDSTLQVVKSRLTPHNFNKHQDFFEQNYRGMKGLEAYLNFEKKGVSEAFGRYVYQIQNAVINESNRAISKEEAVYSYGRIKIPSTVGELNMLDSLDNRVLLTTDNVINADESRYLAGVYKSEKETQNVVAYLARISPEGKVSWYKEYNIEIDSAGTDANNYVTAIRSTPEGCAAIVRSQKLDSDIARNLFIYEKEDGSNIITTLLNVSSYPRSINYNDVTNSFLLAFRDKQYDQNVSVENTTTLINTNVLGDILWTWSNDFKGSLEKIVNTNNGYLIAGNFTSKKNNDGNDVNSLSNGTGMYFDYINNRGELKNTKLINNNSSIYLSDIIKVNDSNINVFGRKGLYNAQSSSEPISRGSDMAYIFTNAKLNIIYSSL